MSKRGKIINQSINRLKAQTKYGESKQNAKDTARAEAKAKGETFKEVRGIYSTSTFNSYSKVCRQFVKCITNEHPEVRSFDDCRQYVPEFL